MKGALRATNIYGILMGGGKQKGGSHAVVYTILGSTGFIGSHLVRVLKQQGVSYTAPDRYDTRLFNQPLGHVINCVGLTADFRERPFDTVRAHVGYITDLLEHADFESFLYLSSTRVYQHATTTQEDSDLTFNPQRFDDLYNLSKVMGESLCLATQHPAVRVARLSNVIGPHCPPSNFVASLLREAQETGHLMLHTTLHSEKDYIDITDVCNILLQIAQHGQHRLYNVASGQNTTHQTLLDECQSQIPFQLEVASDATTTSFPRIDIQRIQTEFGFTPTSLKTALAKMIANRPQRSLVP